LLGERDNARNMVHAGEENHARPGWMDIIKTPRGRVSQNDRDKWRKYVQGAADPRIEDG